MQSSSLKSITELQHHRDESIICPKTIVIICEFLTSSSVRLTTLYKFGHKKLTFTIFICRDADWAIIVQLTEQQQPVKEKR